MQKIKIPLGVKIISLLWFIPGILALIRSGLLFIMLLIVLFEGRLTGIGKIFLSFSGIIAIATIGIFGILISKNLEKRRKWARLLVVILSCIGLILSPIIFIYKGFLYGIVGILGEIIVGGYLLFNKKVKAYFS
ncbi:hypothetical protein HZA33_03660 [Candidatus Pacearchaeota archaeon]|nr:hypothetical protein [Candidatus Pacearchaeota archaeon]